MNGKYVWQLFTEIILTIFAIGAITYKDDPILGVLIFIWIEVRHLIYINK